MYEIRRSMTDYEGLELQLTGLTDGVPHAVANLANAASLIWYNVPILNWAGFYLMHGEGEGKKLVLGPFQGKTACIEIPIGKGVCGTAAGEDRTVVVKDVHDFPGHIACDCASESEIVVPLHRADGSVFGVLDIDSPVKNRFSEADRRGLERLAAVVEKAVGGLL